jgi:hypothetical protein
VGKLALLVSLSLTFPCLATVSPSGRHFAAVNEYGLLYIAADFDRVRQGLQSWEGITTKIILPPPAMHAIWEHEERLIVKAVRVN